MEFQLPNVSRLSKFYSSHMLFAYLVSKSDIFDSSTLDVVRERIEKEGGKYKNSLEAAWGTLALINLRGNKEFIDKGIRQIQESVEKSDLWNPEQFYQHQRLGHIFGSSAGTSIFCLEALSRYKRI